MKISRKHRNLIVLGIAFILILMGLIPMIFQVELNQNIMNRVSLVLMIVAAAVLIGGRRAEADAANEADDNDNTSEQDEA